MASSLYKFSEIQKPNADVTNDPWVLEKCLSKIEHGKPKTFGGIVRNPSNEDVEFESFNTHTPPDITANTRIVAVLGINQKDASPQVDGWFLSDFFAFWNLLQGTTKHQTWYHCLDLDELVQSHTRYLHGNPYKQRKVVLDKEILSKAQNGQHCVQRITPFSLSRQFRTLLRKEFQEAHNNEENVLVLMFGHGMEADNDHAIILGTGYTQKFKHKQFQRIMNGITPKVTLLTTQCYGGGWSCSPSINISTMTASGADEQSASWRLSGSIGRACGSMFTTAVIGKLTQDPSMQGQLGSLCDEDVEDGEKIELAEKQEESYSEFCQSVYATLLRDVDRRGYEHNISFSAQHDAWSMCWRERSGVPLQNFKDRWDQLEDWPADITLHQGDPQNRDPYVTDEQRAEYAKLRDIEMGKGQKEGTGASSSIPHEATGSILGQRKRSSFYSGTLDRLISMVSMLADSYLDSYRGHDETGSDGGFHNTLRRIQSGQERDQDRVENALITLRYRMDQMSIADLYLRIMEVPAPDNLLCCLFDTDGAHRRMPYEKYVTIKKLIFSHSVLFPSPAVGQGWAFHKGHNYLIEAFHKANIPLDIVAQKLDRLAAEVELEVDLLTKRVLDDAEVAAQMRMLPEAMVAQQNHFFDSTLSRCEGTVPSGAPGRDEDMVVLPAMGECTG